MVCRFVPVGCGSRTSVPWLFTLSLAAVGARGSDSTGPGLAIGGTYHATRFEMTVTSSNTKHDILANGGSMVVTLEPSTSAVTGSLIGPTTNGDPITADLAGTYTLTGSVIRFQQDADTFVRDADWIVGGGTLSTTLMGSGTHLVVVLTKDR